ncbi:MAG: hypothetical protein KGZ25_03515 [Planctomycetes bacterium]|nr:hypothetical protein [Planctomycetota bacterium]
MNLMPIERIPDWEKRIERQDAFWEMEIIDRPVANITIGEENTDFPHPPQKDWDCLRDRWWDTEYMAESKLANVMNTVFLGDALPHAHPNLGPEVFSCFFGAEMEYGERTSWSIPNLENWEDAAELEFSWDNKYFQKITEMTDALLEIGEGKFYTGLTDIHPGGDAVAAFRDPERLALDMIEYRDEVKKMVDRVTDVYLEVFDFFCDKLQSAGQAISTWAGIVSSKRWYVPSNDFSCMISSEMFDEVFLPGIVRECEHMEAAIYHLDGPGALQHLDSLLAIDSLNAVQWVYGAGQGPASNWLDVYKKCQDAGKGLQIGIGIGELDLFMDELSPEGLWLRIGGIQNREHAEKVLERLKNWT